MAERNLDDHDVASEPKPRYDDDAKTADERLGEIRQYLLDRRARLDAVATTTTPSGEQVDWVPVESQMSDGRVPDPPDEGGPYRPVSDRDRPTQLGLFELEHDDADLGPPGTVPVRRHLVDRISPDGWFPLKSLEQPAPRLVEALQHKPHASLCIGEDREHDGARVRPLEGGGDSRAGRTSGADPSAARRGAVLPTQS